MQDSMCRNVDAMGRKCVHTMLEFPETSATGYRGLVIYIQLGIFWRRRSMDCEGIRTWDAMLGLKLNNFEVWSG